MGLDTGVCDMCGRRFRECVCLAGPTERRNLDELSRLRTENEKLRMENEKLKRVAEAADKFRAAVLNGDLWALLEADLFNALEALDEWRRG